MRGFISNMFREIPVLRDGLYAEAVLPWQPWDGAGAVRQSLDYANQPNHPGLANTPSYSLAQTTPVFDGVQCALRSLGQRELNDNEIEQLREELNARHAMTRV